MTVTAFSSFHPESNAQDEKISLDNEPFFLNTQHMNVGCCKTKSFDYAPSSFLAFDSGLT